MLSIGITNIFLPALYGGDDVTEHLRALTCLPVKFYCLKILDPVSTAPINLENSRSACYLIILALQKRSKFKLIDHHRKKKSYSLVLKVKKWAALFFRVLTGIYNTVYCAPSTLFLKMYQVLFQRDTSSKAIAIGVSEVNPLVKSTDCSTPLHSTRVLPLNSRILFEIAIPQYPLL